MVLAVGRNTVVHRENLDGDVVVTVEDATEQPAEHPVDAAARRANGDGGGWKGGACAPIEFTEPRAIGDVPAHILRSGSDHDDWPVG